MIVLFVPRQMMLYFPTELYHCQMIYESAIMTVVMAQKRHAFLEDWQVEDLAAILDLD
jgi:hypothetical protein